MLVYMYIYIYMYMCFTYSYTHMSYLYTYIHVSTYLFNQEVVCFVAPSYLRRWLSRSGVPSTPRWSTNSGFAAKGLGFGFTDRPHSSSFLGLPYRILNMNPNKELLWGLWVVLWDQALGLYG